MTALLQAMGNPQTGYPCVVVAGTNGKGSTSALMARALQRAGHRVGLYTSPHLLRFTERIRVNGEEIAPQAVATLATLVQGFESACPRAPTFFECVTAMAVQHFAHEKVDCAVLEVGLGGRLDATNAVDKVLAVITPVALDHQAYLGETLAEIAAEKAGIIQDGVPVVVGPQHPDAMAVIRGTAQACRAPLRAVPRVQPPAPHGGRFWPAYLWQNRAIAEEACAVLDTLDLSCPPSAFAAAADTFSWPGRYQWYDGNPPVLVDGAHNVAGCEALLATLDHDPRVGSKPLHAVFSAVQGKDADSMVQLLRPRLASLHLCGLSSRRNRTQEELRALDASAPIHPTCAEALRAAQAAARANRGMVLVAGSLFLVADAQALLEDVPRDPAVDG